MVVQPNNPSRTANFESVVMSPKIQADPRLVRLIESAMQTLEDSIYRKLTSVSARWDWATDGVNRPAIEATFVDWASEVRGVFTLDELNDPDRMELRLNRLYGDLLRNRSHKMLDKLLAPAESGEDE